VRNSWNSKSGFKYISAFTALELLFTVTISSILIAIAIPELNKFSSQRQQNNILLIWSKNLDFLKNEAASGAKAVTLTTDNYSEGFIAKDAFGKTVLAYKNTMSNIKITSSQYSKSSPITFNTLGGADNTGELNFILNSCNFATMNINIAGQITVTHKDC